ncbi:MAG: hypothetical protein JWN33_31 [Candidatus Saccharibacteria bacterium]|nr:hypothetical protein [Candidatus Saccharibacteria bacterium]
MDKIPIRTVETESAPAPTPVVSQRPHNNPPLAKKSRRKLISGKRLAALIISLLVVLAFVAGALFLYRSNVAAQIDSGKSQAVFFTNGQVYFGKLEKIGGDYFKLTNIFYLQTQSTTQDNATNPQKSATDANASVELIKLGSEIHGPEDQMIFHKDQLLFFENLKTDSTVSKTITEYNGRTAQ